MKNARWCDLGEATNRENIVINKEAEEKIDRTHFTVLAVLMKLRLIFMSAVDPLVGVVAVVKIAKADLGEQQGCTQEYRKQN